MKKDKKFNQHFNDCIIRLAITNTKFLKKVQGILKPEHFESKLLYDIIKICFDYYNEYKKAPKNHFYDEFEKFIDKKNFGDSETNIYIKYIKKIKNFHSVNFDYIVNNISDFIKERDVAITLLKGAEYLEKGDVDKSRAYIKKRIEIIQKKNELLIGKTIQGFTNKLNLAEQILEIQPLHYDKSKIWWLWDSEIYNWIMIDETDILNLVSQYSSADTVKAKDKTEIVEALKQESRKRKPEDMKDSWVQIKDRIYDLNNPKDRKHKYIKATSKYFITNPINWKLGDSEETKQIDELFKSWVGEENINDLYETIAFCLTSKYFIHRMTFLVGSGANGKSTFLKILRKLLGENNYMTTSLDDLIGARFETAGLYKKLLCLMGETNYTTLRKTEKLKSLTGEDSIRGEFKNKDIFKFENYAKIIMATNALPMTDDITEGFYRRQRIIRFNNKFIKEKDVVSKIPDIEYENLTLKCLNILRKYLWKDKTFKNDGTFEDRKKEYEELSNPLPKYLEENYTKDVNAEVSISEFYDAFIKYLKNTNRRILTKVNVTKEMSKLGFQSKLITRYGLNQRCYIGIKEKEIEPIIKRRFIPIRRKIKVKRSKY